jgi:nucleotide-binding universal stress UspA family protein
VSFVGKLRPPLGGRTLVVRVLEPVHLPSIALLSAPVRATLTAQAAAMQAARVRTARRNVDAAVAQLEKSGWRARGEVKSGVPLAELLLMVKRQRADLLVVGARGVSRVERFFLGSVADAVAKRSSVSVLIAR